MPFYRREVSEIIRWIPIRVSEKNSSGQYLSESLFLDLKDQKCMAKDFKPLNGPCDRPRNHKEQRILDNEVEIDEAHPELNEHEEEWSLPNVKYCGLTPRAIIKDSINRSLPTVVADSFVSLFYDGQRESMSLSIIPFPTGCQTTKETRTLILADLKSEVVFNFEILTATASKALVLLCMATPVRFVLLDFSI